MGGRSGRFVWVCMMVLMAFVTVGIGAMGVMERIRMEPAQIVLNPSISEAGRQQLAEEVKSDASGYMSVTVQYTFKNGTTLLQNGARLKPYEVSSLLAGQSMRVHYDKTRPYAVFRQGDLPQPAGWLIGGLVLAGVAWFAMGLWRKEREQYEEDY
jgi:hypothetical protein